MLHHLQAWQSFSSSFEKMKERRVPDEIKSVELKEFDLCYTLVWNKKTQKFCVKNIWCEDNFTGRDHILNLKHIKLWKKQIVSFVFSEAFKCVLLNVKPHVNFELEESEVPLLLNAFEEICC